jgi:hypothetical protein
MDNGLDLDYPLEAIYHEDHGGPAGVTGSFRIGTFDIVEVRKINRGMD